MNTSVVQISMSAALPKKDDRVIVKAAKDEWYTGVVTRVGAKSLSVLFDDKATSVIKPEDYADVRAMRVNYVSEEPLTDAEAKKLYTKPGKATKIESIKIAIPADEKLSAVDARLLTHGVGDAWATIRGSNNPGAYLKWMTQMWHKLNRVYFKSEMQPPKLVYLTFAQEQSWKIGGCWRADSRELCLGNSVFERVELLALKAMLHEMCHQAVSELDRKVGVGHGEAWGRRMYSVDLHVYLQTDITHDVPYMLQFEPLDAADLPSLTNSPQLTTDTLKQFYRMPVKDTPAIAFSKSGQARRGLLLGNDEESTTAIFLYAPAQDKFLKLELSEMFVMNPDDHKEYLSPQWRDSARRVSTKLGLRELPKLGGPVFAMGNRVMVRVGINKYTAGTVAHVTDAIQVRLDDGTKSDFLPHEFDRMRLITTKRKQIGYLNAKQAAKVA